MKWLKRLLWGGLFLLIVIVAFAFCLPYLNDYQSEGKLPLTGLKKPVTVKRDEKGMAFIYAENMHDAIMAQGFVTAQDRLFQMQLTRLLAQGRICELAGEKARNLDIRMRTIGLHRIAQKQAKILNKETRDYFQIYVDGVNAFIEQCPGDIPLEFKLAGIKPEIWSVTDSLCILYYMAYSISANLQTEIVTQMLVETVGPDKATEILPININPDDPGNLGETFIPALGRPSAYSLKADENLLTLIHDLPHQHEHRNVIFILCYGFKPVPCDVTGFIERVTKG